MCYRQLCQVVSWVRKKAIHRMKTKLLNDKNNWYKNFTQNSVYISPLYRLISAEIYVDDKSRFSTVNKCVATCMPQAIPVNSLLLWPFSSRAYYVIILDFCYSRYSYSAT